MIVKTRFQASYYDESGKVIVDIDVKNLAAVKRWLAKKSIRGPATIFDDELKETFYYKPRIN